MTLGNWDTTNWSDEVIAKLKLDFANGALGVKIIFFIRMISCQKAG